MGVVGSGGVEKVEGRWPKNAKKISAVIIGSVSTLASVHARSSPKNFFLLSTV